MRLLLLLCCCSLIISFPLCTAILVYAVFDRDLSVETLEKNAHIYSLTRGPVLFNYFIFARWLMIAFVQAALCFFIPFMAFDTMTSPSPDGQSFGIWSAGICVYVCVVITTNMKLVWEFQSWTIYHHLSLWGSIVVFVSAMALFSSSPKFAIGGADYYFVFYRLLALARFWLIVILTVGLCMMLDLAHHHYLLTFHTSATHRLIEAERRGGPEAVRRLAKQLHRQQLSRQQSELLEKYSAAKSRVGSRRGSGLATGPKMDTTTTGVTSSWDQDRENTLLSPQAQKNALLNRRSRMTSSQSAYQQPSRESDVLSPLSDEYDDEIGSPSELPRHSGGGGSGSGGVDRSYTGSNFVFTPRSTFLVATEPEEWQPLPSIGATQTTTTARRMESK